MANHNMSSVRRRWKRETLLKRHGPLCPACDQAFSAENPPTLAHLQAYSEGGSNHLSNLGLLCLTCQRAGIDHPRAVPSGCRSGGDSST